MAKASKPKKETKKRGKYDEKLAVKGSFLDLINASMKHANEHSAKADKPAEKKKP